MAKKIRIPKVMSNMDLLVLTQALDKYLSSSAIPTFMIERATELRQAYGSALLDHADDGQMKETIFHVVCEMENGTVKTLCGMSTSKAEAEAGVRANNIYVKRIIDMYI